MPNRNLGILDARDVLADARDASAAADLVRDAKAAARYGSPAREVTFSRATASAGRSRRKRNSAPRARSRTDRTAGTHPRFPRDERTTFFAEEIPRHVERPDRGWWAPVSEGFLASRPTTMAPRKKPLVKPEDAANLRVLQREDPEVEAILGSASHVTLYGFNLEEQAWVSDPALSPLRRGRARSP